jgi:hypothetical protein
MSVRVSRKAQLGKEAERLSALHMQDLGPRVEDQAEDDEEIEEEDTE